MALNRKYAALPDLDSAPDIYETPELTDDNSTVPGTTVRSPSETEFDDGDDGAGISRTRLRIDQARSRFMPANVDARDVDFSDRVNGKRKSYRASSRRQRILEDGTEEYGELSDEEEGEDLARKLARLKREIEEAKEEYGRQQQAAKEDATATAVQEGEIASLSRALEEITRLSTSTARGVAPRPAGATSILPTGTTAQPQQPSTPMADTATYTLTYAPTYSETHALAKAADFDRRLLLLEQALGIGSLSLPGLDANGGHGLPRAVLPTLDSLQKQISTLSGASTSSLDSISRRVRALAQEAENLEKTRREAAAAHEALVSSTGVGAADAASGAAPVDAADAEQTARINALYGTLPTIESLAPLLPPLLDRLRSLRAIHADAAAAGEALARAEKNQADMAGDIRQWREALEKVEGAVREGEGAMAGNMGVVEGWVRELEERVGKLG